MLKKQQEFLSFQSIVVFVVTGLLCYQVMWHVSAFDGLLSVASEHQARTEEYPCATHDCACHDAGGCAQHCCCFPKKPDQVSLKNENFGEEELSDVLPLAERPLLLIRSGTCSGGANDRAVLNSGMLFYDVPEPARVICFLKCLQVLKYDLMSWFSFCPSGLESIPIAFSF